ncbi:hypothetical protein A3J13_01485 [Candidatus Daviesbacteria bacterium RIFCSPLOWO2_02_FULL_36_8]|uniref:Type II secretion system protein GspG C-terminal domain-containing protein n=1 Tax=Candidatus Daviesbacteria bacterium RIFCSPLOWO2_02_FULL_36_8 TaxID=1797793 RepID=A0A1F5MGV6_9BACT|nr:MAG: hypothetical protein A3J13_01485 [Candidatus Daviesbacteria bacterium RIFCSPLOWO2_02_FULL_36_8]
MIKKKGFTLIELLVVISIIAVLASIGFVSYQVVLKNSRDAKRQSDLRTIQTGLEQYFADQLFYPYSDSTLNAPRLTLSSTVSLTSSIGTPSAPSSVKTYIQEIPKDPTSGTATPYLYVALPVTPCDNSGTKCTSYCIYAKMESFKANGVDIGNTAPSNCPAYSTLSPNTYNFAVTLP